MIIKPSTRADDLQAITAMIDGEFESFPAALRKHALAQIRGLKGERYVAFILDREFHDSKDHAILHDLRLSDGIGGHAQFDHIIPSRLSRSATIVEVKNYAGRLSRNEHDEWRVWYKGQRAPIDIPNPLKQAERQGEILRAWLVAHKHDLAFERIGRFVVVPPDCTIDRKSVKPSDGVYKADNLMDGWLPFGGISGWGRLFSAGITTEGLRNIAMTLRDDHRPVDGSLLQRLGLAPA